MICKNCEREIVPHYGCQCSCDDSLIQKIPSKGDSYRHTNGNIYKIILIANKHSKNAKYPITVIYTGTNNRIWAKSLSNFTYTMTQVDENNCYPNNNY